MDVDLGNGRLGTDDNLGTLYIGRRWNDGDGGTVSRKSQVFSSAGRSGMGGRSEWDLVCPILRVEKGSTL